MESWVGLVGPEPYAMKMGKGEGTLKIESPKALITLCVFGLRFGRRRKGFCAGESSIIFLSDMTMVY